MVHFVVGRKGERVWCLNVKVGQEVLVTHDCGADGRPQGPRIFLQINDHLSLK